MAAQVSSSDRAEVRVAIERHYDRKERLVRSKAPTLDSRIENLAVEGARKVLGISDLIKQRKRAKEQLRKVEEALEAKLPRKKREKYGSCGGRMSECEAVAEIAERLVPGLMASDTHGRQLIEIETNRADAQKRVLGCTTREQMAAVLQSLK